MSKEIMVAKANELTTQELADIHTYLRSLGCQLADHHQAQFIAMCRELSLNPFKREIYGIPHKDKFSIIVGYEVYLKRAERSGQLDGWKFWVEGRIPEMKAKIIIHRKDRAHPFEHEVDYLEYLQMKQDYNTKKWAPNSMWASKPQTMLKKVVIAQGFRLFFPEDCGGIPYISEEVTLDEAVILPHPDSDRAGVPLSEQGATDADVKTDGAADQAPGPVQDGEVVDEPQLTAQEKRDFISQGFPSEERFLDFIIKKSWLSAGQALADLTDNQVERLYNNYRQIETLYTNWKENTNV